MFSSLFSRRQSQRSLHPAGSFWRYFMGSCLQCRQKPHSRMSICLVNHGILRLTRCHFVYSRARPNCWKRPWQCWTVRGRAGKTNERESWMRESRRSSCQACLCRIYRYQLCGEESTQITHMQSSNPWIKHMREKMNTSYLHLTSPCRIFAKSCT